MNPKIRNSLDSSTWPHFGQLTESNDAMSSPSGNSVVGRVKMDLQEMSLGLFVMPSNAAWHLEHVCMGSREVV